MVTRFQVGEDVWVPSSKLGGNRPYALTTRRVIDLVDRSVVVDDGAGDSVRLSTRLVHPTGLGFLLLTVGDLKTEWTLLNPLAKSALQYLRLLIPDEEVRALHVRTRHEIHMFLAENGAAFSHVILVGHGSKRALLTLDGEVRGKDLAEMLDVGEPKVVVSLACHTGKAEFARPLSRSAACREYVAPFDELHGAAAVCYLTTLLQSNLLNGHEFMTAARHANAAAEGFTIRHWRNGALQ